MNAFLRKYSTCVVYSTNFYFRCSRGHPKPESGHTLLFPGMYSHFKLSALTDEYDTGKNINFIFYLFVTHMIPYFDHVD